MLLWSSKWDCKWTASSEFDTYRPCEQRRFRRACASAQSCQNFCYSLLQAVSQEEPSDRKPDPWPLWMAGHVQLKFVMTESSKTQIRLTGLKCRCWWILNINSLKSCYDVEIFLNICIILPPAYCHWNSANEPHHEKTCFSHMRSTKVQISLRICTVWSASLLFAA